MKRLMVLLLTGVVFLQGCAMASELVDEVKQVRENNHATRINVTDIIRKHIKTPSSWDALSKQLAKDGFKCQERIYSETNSNSATYDCKLDLRHWYNLGFGDELRLVIYVKNGSAIAVIGALFYLAL